MLYNQVVSRWVVYPDAVAIEDVQVIPPFSRDDLGMNNNDDT